MHLKFSQITSDISDLLRCILHKMKHINILDGGFGTQISKSNNISIDGDVLWSARLLHTRKTDVINTHLEFLQAGSNVISTNTYQASINGFIKHLNLSEQDSYNLIKEAVYLAKKARSVYTANSSLKSADILIAGSVGPYGASLHDGSEYTGSYKDCVSSSTLKQWHMPRVAALIEGGVDLLAFETLPCRKEAEVLLSILKEYPNVKAWLSFNCKDGKSLASGEDFQTTIKECYEMSPNQLVAVGTNCVSPTFVDELFKNINIDVEVPAIPLIVYPNSGESYSNKTGWQSSTLCKPIENYVENWLDMGVTWIGGCCRMYSEDITKIKQAVEQWKSKHL